VSALSSRSFRKGGQLASEGGQLASIYLSFNNFSVRFCDHFLKRHWLEKLSTVYSFKGKVYLFYCDPATRLKGKLPKFK
jgi:hypothetical protein